MTDNMLSTLVLVPLFVIIIESFKTVAILAQVKCDVFAQVTIKLDEGQLCKGTCLGDQVVLRTEVDYHVSSFKPLLNQCLTVDFNVIRRQIAQELPNN